MGVGDWYEQRILPLVVERACSMPGIQRLRPKATAGLFGTVVEVGFGSGPNISFYPDAVDRVLAIEPSDLARERARRRIHLTSAVVEFVGLDGSEVPLEDGSADSGLVTFSLCTIANVEAALGELRRVLKPGAPLFALEHGLAPDQDVAQRQRRWNAMQVRLAGGCHLDRDPVALLRTAGFESVVASQRYLKSTPRVLGFTSLVSATNPHTT